MVGIQYNNISISSQKCRFPIFQCKFPEVKQADYQEGQQHGTGRGLEFTSHRHVSARALLERAHCYDLVCTNMVWRARIWLDNVFYLVCGSTCAQERGCTDGGYLVCTEAQRAPARERVHLDRVACCAAEKMLLTASDRNEMSVSLVKQNMKNSYIRYSASKTTLNHQLSHFIGSQQSAGQ